MREAGDTGAFCRILSLDQFVEAGGDGFPHRDAFAVAGERQRPDPFGDNNRGPSTMLTFDCERTGPDMLLTRHGVRSLRPSFPSGRGLEPAAHHFPGAHEDGAAAHATYNPTFTTVLHTPP